jgi:hypothetical protein
VGHGGKGRGAVGLLGWLGARGVLRVAVVHEAGPSGTVGAIAECGWFGVEVRLVWGGACC